MTPVAPQSSRARWVRPPHLVLLAAAWLAIEPALARDLTAPERAALTQTADHFEAATKEGDGPEIAAILPPRMLQWIAKQNGGSPDSVVQSTAEAIDKIKEAGIRMTVTLDLAHAEFDSLKDGTPYVVIPTHGGVNSPKHMDLQINTLALMEDGTWYLLDISSDARQDRLRKAFPEFADVALPKTPSETKP